MIKLIAVDMDGTLLDDQKNFSEELYSIVERMKAKNCRLVIATGNQYELVQEKFYPIKDELIYLCENGAKLVYHDQILYTNTLSESLHYKILDMLVKIDHIIIVMCGTKHAYLRKSDQQYNSMIRNYYRNIEYVDDLNIVEDQIMKFSICQIDGHIQEIADILLPFLPSSLQLITTGNIWFDIFDAKMTKGTTMAKLQEILHISKDECAAFGDQMNDYGLLESVTHSYAMKNAVEPLKQIAEAITEYDNNHNGVIEEIKKMGF